MRAQVVVVEVVVTSVGTLTFALNPLVPLPT
jgi:hypothetical protein